jgi:flap endonuclease-1
MGIDNFLDVCPPSKIVSFKDMVGKKLAIDAFVEIFRTSGVQYISGLTNPQGEPTQHIKAIFSNVTKLEKLGIKCVWCIDSREPPMEKKQTQEERMKVREMAQKQAEDLGAEIKRLEELAKKLSVDDLKSVDADFQKTLEEKKDKLLKLDSRVMKPGQFNKYVQDTLMILTKLGVPYCVAPSEVEAEQLGAYLCSLGICDGVMTTDTDAMPFGAPWMMKKIPKKTGKYELITREDCLKDLTYDQLVEVCVALGCDYADKVPRVGPKTVVTKVKGGSIVWTPKQLAAIASFKRKLNFSPQIIRTQRTASSVQELKDWLIKVQGFGEANVHKVLDELPPAS